MDFANLGHGLRYAHRDRKPCACSTFCASIRLRRVITYESSAIAMCLGDCPEGRHGEHVGAAVQESS